MNLRTIQSVTSLSAALPDDVAQPCILQDTYQIRHAEWKANEGVQTKTATLSISENPNCQDFSCN